MTLEELGSFIRARIAELTHKKAKLNPCSRAYRSIDDVMETNYLWLLAINNAMAKTPRAFPGLRNIH